MKRILCVLAALVFLAGFNGCQNSPTFPETPQTQPGRVWASGLVLTFPSLPSAATAGLLEVAGATNYMANDFVYVIGSYDRRNQAQGAALEAALREGAVLTPP